LKVNSLGTGARSTPRACPTLFRNYAGRRRPWRRLPAQSDPIWYCSDHSINREKPRLATPAEVFYLYEMTHSASAPLSLYKADVFSSSPNLSIFFSGIN